MEIQAENPPQSEEFQDEKFSGKTPRIFLIIFRFQWIKIEENESRKSATDVKKAQRLHKWERKNNIIMDDWEESSQAWGK